MKKIYLIIAAAVVAAAIFIPNYGKATENCKEEKVMNNAAAQVEAKGKVLVAYFTWPEQDGVDAASGASRVMADGKIIGNTEYIARLIAKETDGDLFAIQTKKTYPAPHRALINEAKREAEANERPEITSHIQNLNEYDIVFVGYPNWWYDLPMVIYSFFDEYDFSGKTVIPFVTHGGSRFSQTVQTITDLEKGARVTTGPSVAARNVPDAQQTIHSWLEKQGLLK